MRSVGSPLLLLCLIAVSFEAPYIPPGFVTCTHKFKAGHEWVGQINSKLCYKQLSVESKLHKKEAENGCKQYEMPEKPEDGPVSHLPFLRTQADRDGFLNLTFNTPCYGKDPICLYWIGIEMVSYVPDDPNQILWKQEDPTQSRGVVKYRWDDGEEETDWERKDFIEWGKGFLEREGPIADHNYVVAGGRARKSPENVYNVPQTYYMITNEDEIIRLDDPYHFIASIPTYCQKIIDSPLIGPPSTSTTLTRPLPSKHTQPTTVRTYARRTILVRQTRSSSHKSTRVQEIVPSSSEEGGLSSTVMYILAGGFGVLLVVAMLIAVVYGMHSKGNSRRHKRKGHKVKTNEDEPRSSTARDMSSNTTEHS